MHNMQAFSWARWWPLAGVAFVLFWIIAFVIDPGEDTDDTDAQIVAHWADSGTRHKQYAVFFLILAASLAFVWFLGGLRHRIQQAEGGPGLLTELGFGAGLVAVALWSVAGAMFSSVAFAVGDSDMFQLDPDLARFVATLGYTVWFSGTTIAAILVAATGIVALRTRVLPAWLAWLSFLVALTMLAAFAFIPFVILLLWILLVSATLIVRPTPVAPPAATMQA
jgi:hypothetical protein